MKINFKTGTIVGIALGLALCVYGFFFVQNMMEKAKNVAEIDLNQFLYEDLMGNEVTLRDFEGKNVVLNFWATWCGPCIGEFPLLQKASSELKESFVFIMVSYEKNDKIKQFVDENSYDFVFLKSNNFLVEGISSLPQSFILDKEGKTVHHHPTIFEGDIGSLVGQLKEFVMTD